MQQIYIHTHAYTQTLAHIHFVAVFVCLTYICHLELGTNGSIPENEYDDDVRASREIDADILYGVR